MTKTFFMLVFAFAVSLTSWAQEQFVGTWNCEALKASMVMDLQEKSIPFKGFDSDEDTYGYVKGQLNGTWVILKVKKMEEKKALVRMVSDIGYDAQDVEFRLKEDGTMEMRLVGDQVMKTIEKGKYVKMPKAVIFQKNEK